MLACPACRRFVREGDVACPFCTSPRATTLAPVTLVVALGVALAACGPTVAVDDGSAEGSSSGAGSSASVGEGPGTSPGTSAGTSPGTTDNTTNTSVATTVDPDTGTATTTDGDDDLDDEGGAFYGGPPDGGGVNIECDVWAQDCQDGEKCMPWANDGGTRWNATRCAPLDPRPGAPGDPCMVEGSAYSGIDNCALGAFCWDVDPATNQGTCAANCANSEANPICADDGSTQCMIDYDGVIHLCLSLCDPRLQSCIPTSECVPTSDAFFCVPDNSGDEGQYADGCSAFDACDPGLFCANAELVPGCVDIGCCTEFCDLALPDPNTQCSGVGDGMQCIPWYEDGQAPPGYELLGVCVLPG